MLQLKTATKTNKSPGFNLNACNVSNDPFKIMKIIPITDNNIPVACNTESRSFSMKNEKTAMNKGVAEFTIDAFMDVVKCNE
jgi:hypothetical protein